MNRELMEKIAKRKGDWIALLDIKDEKGIPVMLQPTRRFGKSQMKQWRDLTNVCMDNKNGKIYFADQNGNKIGRAIGKRYEDIPHRFLKKPSDHLEDVAIENEAKRAEKNRQFGKTASLDYGEMVKMAYEDIAEGFEKEAATVKELKKSYKYDTGFKRPFFYNGAEGFGRRTGTYISPVMYEDGDFGYEVLTTGAARKADTMEARQNLLDLVRRHKADDKEREEYDARMNPKIKEFGDARKKFFAPIRKYKSKKALLEALTDAERDYLVSERNKRGKAMSDAPYENAHHIKTQTTHYY
jgi:hypothetical protein